MKNSSSIFWNNVVRSSGSSLDSVDRVNEVLFGLIMVLTFTCTISAANEGGEQVSTILWAALGCNVAWGIIDAFMLLFSVMMYRGGRLSSLRAIREAPSDEVADELIKDEVSPLVKSILKDEDYDYLRAEIKKLPELPEKIILTWNDFKGAIGAFLLVFISTFPVTIPFIFVKDILIATRISNGIALLLLFITGYYLGKKTGYPSFITAFGMMFIGALLVAATIALGG